MIAPLPEFWTSVGIFAAFFAAVFAGAALVVAVATLKRIDKQLDLARQELKAVKDDFELSQEQFKLGQKQFDLGLRQFDEIMRRPNLSVKVLRFGEDEAFATFEGGARPRIVSLRFVVTNEGDAVARDVLLEVFIQHDHLAAFDSFCVRFGNDEVNTAQGKSYFLHRDSTTYIRYDFTKSVGEGHVIYPMGHTLEFVATFLFRPQYKYTRPLWRVFDQYALYPRQSDESEQFGRFPDLYLTSKL